VARQYGVSTCLYQQRRLGRDHLLEIAAHGFDAVELFAARLHLDYHNPVCVSDLQQWLTEAGLELTSVHAPATEASLASADAGEREQALAETERALHIGRRIQFRSLVVHLGKPRTAGARGGTNRDAARRSVDTLAKAAEPLGIDIALEVIPNDLSRAASLTELVDEDIEAANVGICLDLGHARIDHPGGDVGEAVEVAAGHLLAIDVHDNRGRSDDHLVPFDGVIDWPAALTSVQKVGYDGPLTFELSTRGSPRDALARARQARTRMDKLMAVR
jgi:sugar phosphate isomerase/epimerase